MGNNDLYIYFEYLISLLKRTINSEDKSFLSKNEIDKSFFSDDFDFKLLYSLAKMHSVTPTIYPLLKNISSPAINLFKVDYQKSWRKTAVQFIELSSILSKVDEFGINCIPLKGSVIKDYYPSPEMRTMADIDFLFDVKKIEDIKLIMYQLGYTPGNETDNHFTFYKEPIMNVEFHPCFFKHGLFKDDYLNPGWQYATHTGKQKPLRKLTNEGFFIFMMAHITQHFKSGGAGIRSVMDVWVFLQHFKNNLDWLFINHELRHAGILEFSENIIRLAQAWFGNKKTTLLLDELGTYIIKSGTFGQKFHYLNNRVSKSKTAFIIKTIFPPSSVMKRKYSVIKKIPLMLPIGWIVRALEIIVFRKKYLKTWLDDISLVNQKTAKEHTEMFKRFGL